MLVHASHTLSSYKHQTVSGVCLMTGVYSASCMEYLYTLCGKKGKVVPVHATKAYWGSRSTAPLIRDLGTRWKWVVSFTNRPLYR